MRLATASAVRACAVPSVFSVRARTQRGHPMTKGSELEGAKKDGAIQTLDEAKPLLLRALVKCGHIPTSVWLDPSASHAERLLAITFQPPDPKLEYFDKLARAEVATWRELRQKIDTVACRLADLAKRRKLDPLVALRAAFLMRVGVDQPLGPLDVSAIVDLAALVSLLVELEEEHKPSSSGPRELGQDAAMFANAPRILTPLSKDLWRALRAFGERGARSGDVKVPGLSSVASTRLREFKVLEAGDHARLEGRRWIAIGNGP
jgi:hypothetical protein